MGDESFWIGERSGNYGADDFDGRARQCRVVRWLEAGELPQPAGPHATLVDVEPPLPLDRSGGPLDQIVVSDTEGGGDLRDLGDDWIHVHLFRRAAPDTAGYRFVMPAVAARAPELLLPRLDDAWRSMFGELSDFAAQHGHVGPPAGSRLATFVHNQKHVYENGRLDSWKVELLESLPTWEWRTKDWFDLLGGYVEREGHSDVPIDHREEGRPLGLWVQQMRQRRTAMAQERIERLEAIPTWHWG